VSSFSKPHATPLLSTGSYTPQKDPQKEKKKKKNIEKKRKRKRREEKRKSKGKVFFEISGLLVLYSTYT
jgi:hypothetical protein